MSRAYTVNNECGYEIEGSGSDLLLQSYRVHETLTFRKKKVSIKYLFYGRRLFSL